MMNTKKTVKKTARKVAKRIVKKNTKTFYGLMETKNLKSSDEWSLNRVVSMKEHPNHTINSYLAHGGTEKFLKNMTIVKMEVFGTPLVKTTREIKIKK